MIPYAVYDFSLLQLPPFELLSCIFMDENQLAKISVARKDRDRDEGNYFSAARIMENEVFR